jgi:tetratricopeptide (TPR) repeat protein
MEKSGMADRFITMLCHTACFMRTGAAACAVGLLVFFGDCLSSRAAVADWLVGEENSKREPLSLSEQAEIIAEAHALYLQAIFEEDEEGPDKALANKRRVLFLDPGITPLAMDLAQHHLRRGETAEAISVLKDTLKVRPRDSSLALALSGIYLRHLKKYPLAEKYITEHNNAYHAKIPFADYKGIARFIRGLCDEIEVLGPVGLKKYVGHQTT